MSIQPPGIGLPPKPQPAKALGNFRALGFVLPMAVVVMTVGSIALRAFAGGMTDDDEAMHNISFILWGAGILSSTIGFLVAKSWRDVRNDPTAKPSIVADTAWRRGLTGLLLAEGGATLVVVAIVLGADMMTSLVLVVVCLIAMLTIRPLGSRGEQILASEVRS